MKNFKKSTLVLLAAAAVLLISSAVGSTRAALTYFSENYQAQVTVSNIGVSLMENDKEDPISYRNYLENGEWDVENGEILKDILNDEFVLGETYPEELKVYNSGAIETYVRVILTKTWINQEGNVDQTLDPNLIQLSGMGEGWVVDESASTPERTILYYTLPLDVDATTTEFTKTFRVDSALQTKVVENVSKEIIDGKEYKTINYTYEYDGYSFNVEAEVDAVQTHNAADAIKSAWGVDVTVDANGVISLQQ